MRFVHIDDAAGAVVAAVDSAAIGTFNIVDDQPTTRQEQAQALSQAVGRRVHLLPSWSARLTGVARGLAYRSQRVSNGHFREATGW
jgi:nucleoside-diphosphate-sugar epimerase